MLYGGRAAGGLSSDRSLANPRRPAAGLVLALLRCTRGRLDVRVRVDQGRQSTELLEALEREADGRPLRAGDQPLEPVWQDRRHGEDRRRTTLRTFLQSGFTPRRRGGRRAGEHHLPIDWHEPYLLFLALTILLLNVADAFLTLTLLTAGAREANPLLEFVLTEHPKLFALTKMALTGTGVLVLVAVARARIFNVMRVGTLLHAVLAGYATLIGYEWWLLRAVL
jgi:hypothetical protein